MSVKYEGVKMTLAGVEYVIPALSLRQVRVDLADDLRQLNAGDPAQQSESLAAGMRIIHAALKRNYPDMTEDLANDIVDLRNFRQIIPAVMGVSGLVPAGE